MNVHSKYSYLTIPLQETKKKQFLFVLGTERKGKYFLMVRFPFNRKFRKVNFVIHRPHTQFGRIDRYISFPETTNILGRMHMGVEAGGLSIMHARDGRGNLLSLIIHDGVIFSH